MLRSASLRAVLLLLLSAIPVFGQEDGPYPPRDLKGLIELDLYTQALSRRVVEETSPGVDFKGYATSTRVMARLGIKPAKPLELYFQTGTANLQITDFNDYRGDYSFAYGGGLNLDLYENPRSNRFRLIASGDFLTFKTDDTVQTTIQSQNVLVKEEIEWLEYSAGITGRWRFENLDPYAGVRFSWLNSTDDIKDPRVGKISLREDSNIGILGGVDIFLDRREKIAINLEASLIDQASIKAGVKLWY